MSRLPRDDIQDNYPRLKMTCREFESLLEYSGSYPTGTTIGKRWKCHVGVFDRQRTHAPYWMIGEYVDSGDASYVDIKWYRPIICVRAASNA